MIPIRKVFIVSYDSRCLFCFPEPNVMFSFSATDEESMEVMDLLEEGNREAQEALTQHYVKILGKLVAREFILGDGTKIGLLGWEKTN